MLLPLLVLATDMGEELDALKTKGIVSWSVLWRVVADPVKAAKLAGPCSWQQECLNGSAHVRVLLLSP